MVILQTLIMVSFGRYGSFFLVELKVRIFLTMNIKDFIYD